MFDLPPVTLPLMTDRLTLRAHEGGDAGWLHGIYSRPDVARYLLDEPWSEEDAARHASERLSKTDFDGDSGALALVVEYQGAPIGDVLLWLTDKERRVAEIGWVLDPAHGGRGFAREAVAEVLRVAFDHELGEDGEATIRLADPLATITSPETSLDVSGSSTSSRVPPAGLEPAT